MSILKKPEEAVPLLLGRLDKAKKHALSAAEGENEIQSKLEDKFESLKMELESMRDVFPRMKRWEKTMMDQFCDLEQELDDDIFKDPQMQSQVQVNLDLMTISIKDLRKSIPNVDKIPLKRDKSTIKPAALDEEDHPIAVCPQWVSLGVDSRILESEEAMSSFFASFHFLSGSSQAKMCSLFLSLFPKNSIIEKTSLIYWWMGEGLVKKTDNNTAEEDGEQVFRELMDEGFIRASRKNKSLSVRSFVIDPWIHRMLILIAKQNFFSEFDSEWTPCNGKRRAFLCQGGNDPPATEDVIMVFNVDKQYLGMKPEWLSKLKNVEVLHMGRWQNSVTHHIEVEDQTLFNALGSHKHLKYLSLCGISRIESLPDSISNLISLQILDLRACHNLEKLPLTISKLKNLTHLDVSHCYLLESIPKGIEQLISLQVIKGFVIGKAEKNSCKISDLARLKSLVKMTIRVGNQGEGDQLGSLDTLPALRTLTISWGEASCAQWKAVTLPKKLKKLGLRCVPFDSVPDWLSPSNLPSALTKLYIKGGRLRSLENKDKQVWRVKYLRFKYLKDLHINEGDLQIYKYWDEYECYELIADVKSTGAADQPVDQTKIEGRPRFLRKRSLIQFWG